MSVDGSIAGRASQILILSVNDVLAGSRVPELLGQPEVDEKELIAVAPDAHEEVVGFDISVDEALGVDVLYAADHLVRKHQDCFCCEASRAEVEEVF